MEKYIPCKSNQKRARVNILRSEKYFEVKLDTRDNEGHIIKIKVSIHQEDIIIIDLYSCNNRV